MIAGSCTTYWIFFVVCSLCQLGASQNDPVSNQLPEYAKKHTNKPPLTSDGGHPRDSADCTLTVGPHGPMIIDATYLEMTAHFNRERIPERVVHARGSGAFGYLEVTHDITKYTKAKVFEKVGKITPVAIRFSLAVAERGSAETIRDTRGLAIKFYTEDGIWDIPGSAFPVFFFRDPTVAVHFSHSLKRNPRTNIMDNTAFWDFFSTRPETLHTLMYFFGDRGIPDGYRHMDGFGVNTFKLENDKKEIFYAKLHFRTDQGEKYLSTEKARNISAEDPDYCTRDLYNAIENEQYPSWTFYMQVMKEEDAAKYRWNPFDVTKLWLIEDYPLIPVGKIILNRNPKNYFAEIEQLAFCPANYVPGIVPSIDRILHGRLFAYPDAQRYRLGPNYFQLPVNRPKQWLKVRNFNRDGSMVFYNQGDDPSYYPNSFNGAQPVPSAAEPPYNASGIVKRWDLGNDDNFSQPQLYWNKVLKQDEKERITECIIQYLKLTNAPMQKKAIRRLFQPLDEKLAQKLVEKLQLDPEVLKSD